MKAKTQRRERRTGSLTHAILYLVTNPDEPWGEEVLTAVFPAYTDYELAKRLILVKYEKMQRKPVTLEHRAVSYESNYIGDYVVITEAEVLILSQKISQV